MPDRVVALVQYLKEDSAVGSATEGRVWPQEIPDRSVSRMPRPSVVVRDSGGPQTIRRGQTSNSRVDIRCYATTPHSAKDIHNFVYAALDDLTTTVVGATLLHSALPSMGPMSMREPPVPFPGEAPDNRKHWPVVISSWVILAADVEAVRV